MDNFFMPIKTIAETELRTELCFNVQQKIALFNLVRTTVINDYYGDFEQLSKTVIGINGIKYKLVESLSITLPGGVGDNAIINVTKMSLSSKNIILSFNVRWNDIVYENITLDYAYVGTGKRYRNHALTNGTTFIFTHPFRLLM